MFPLFQRPGEDAVIRPLTAPDWGALEQLIATDPVTFLYAAEHLETFGLPQRALPLTHRPAVGFMGIFESEPTVDTTVKASPITSVQAKEQLPLVVARAKQAAGVFLGPISAKRKSSAETLSYIEKRDSTPQGEVSPQREERMVGAFWLGSNCVPLVVPERSRTQVANLIAKSSRTVASIFGASSDVLPLWELVQHRMGKPLSVRENQPLLYLGPERSLNTTLTDSLYRPQLPAPQIVSAGTRWARHSDRRSLLKASVAMFTEEVGYDPLTRDPAGYARRVDEFIRAGRSVVATNTDGVVVFKTDLGLTHADSCQIQGVWLHPAYRGFGLSEPLLAQAFQLIRPRYPHISLYVNDYNVRARKLYEALGMEQINTFSTILF
ncbi:MAG: GNAT family N-acetyltransferase [Rothia sp. (in: high G+C Gram-positive bacteria)]|nr:GNAT family N-acetyltransferase [Rothia sp. (in: high G+C Gram-positive bacteria)]